MIVESRNGTILQRCGMICTVSSSVSGFGYTYWWLNCSVFVQITPQRIPQQINILLVVWLLVAFDKNLHFSGRIILKTYTFMREYLCNITLFWTNNRSVIIFLQIFCFRLKIKKDTSETCSDVPLVVWIYS